MTKLEKRDKPKWSLFSLFVFSSVYALLAVVFFCLTGDRPLWVDLEIAISVCGGTLFILYWWILFHGVQVDSNEKFDVTLVKMPDIQGFDIGDPGFVDVGDLLGGLAELGPLGLIVAIPIIVVTVILASIVLAVAAYILVYVGINLTLISFFMVGAPLFFVFKHSILYVLRHQVESHNRLLTSARWAFTYAAPKTILLYGVVFLAHFIRMKLI